MVIVADEEYHAQRVYRSIGYQLVEWQVGLNWWEGMGQTEA
ncbi:MAG: hypothetical protein R3C14_31410 [Caldilineaceae bacterium]